jgi:Response regulator containing CheY-like receiver and SARP domains
MRFLVVDDEPLVITDVTDALYEVMPDCDIETFTTVHETLKFFENIPEEGMVPIDVAFLDIHLGTTSGLVLAKQLKDIQPDIHIIFVTGFAQYALPAIQMHATGYLMKPVNPLDIARELTFLYGEDKGKADKNIRIQTFGGFAIFVDDKLLTFKRQKAKELLACLVDRQGADITTKMACALLWEDESYDRKVKGYFRIVLLDLRITLREAGIEKLLIRGHNRLAVDITKFDCDSYNFIKGDPIAVNAYQGNYLIDYSWAELMNGSLHEKIK